MIWRHFQRLLSSASYLRITYYSKKRLKFNLMHSFWSGVVCLCERETVQLCITSAGKTKKAQGESYEGTFIWR